MSKTISTIRIARNKCEYILQLPIWVVVSDTLQKDVEKEIERVSLMIRRLDIFEKKNVKSAAAAATTVAALASVVIRASSHFI